MRYLTGIGLLGATLSVSVMVIPTSAAPIVDATSRTHQLSQAQPNTQPKRIQSIHITVIGEVQRPGAYFLGGAGPNRWEFYVETAVTDCNSSDSDSWRNNSSCGCSAGSSSPTN